MARNGKALQALFVSVLFLFSILVVMTAAAGEAEYTIITTAQLKAMMDEKKSFTLVDTRSKEEYEEAHIPGAISIPEKNFDDMKSILPVDKSSLLVLYCNGVKCGKSKRTAKKAEAAGYKNVLVYGDGFPVWEEKNNKIVAGPEYGKKIETTKLKPVDLKSMIDSKQDYMLVDVRETTEFQEGHVPTAVNIPVETFASKQGDLPKEKKIIVYCNTGSRSYLAYRKLIRMDYKNIYQTLFDDWKEAGFPVDR